jgi:rubrerythrin
MNFDSVNEILDFAIQKEQEAADYYTELSQKMDTQWMKETFLNFAAEEKGHKTKLLEVKKGNMLLGEKSNVMDLKISDYIAQEDPETQDFIYQDALIIAMLREKASFKLYTDLAHRVKDPAVKDIFSKLALEEAKHKLRFELEYDQYVLTQN